MKLSLPLLIFFFFLNFHFTFTSGQHFGGSSILDYFQQNKTNEGHLSITMDPLIEENLNKHLLYNAKNPFIQGYRIRIFSDSGFGSHENALSIRTRFISKYDNIGAYLQYDVPNYKVYIGDCRTRSEALRILEMVKKDYPYAFIVAQNINLTED